MDYKTFNQIKARALIGQSAMAYCASKPMEKITRLNSELLYKSKGPQRRTLEEYVNHSPAARDLRILLLLYQHSEWFISL